MKKKLLGLLLIIFLSFGLTSIAAAQRQTGSIKGIISDTEGFPLPGAFIYLDSLKLLNIQTYITSDTGKIKFHALPPGQYKITVEMPGFKTVNIENIIVRVGMTVKLNITMEMTTVEEETTIDIPSPTLDLESTKTVTVIEGDLLEKIPFKRNLFDVISSASGVIPDWLPFQQTSIIKGSSARANLYSLDGLNVSDPEGISLLSNINFDVIEEIEIETASHPAEVGNIDGGFINVVTKSGGNRLTGGIILYHTNENVANTLNSEEEISAMGVSPPPIDKKLWDISLSLGGSILEDKLWFFSNVRLISQSHSTSFIPWTDPQGNAHEEFDWDNTEKMAFFKLTSQFDPKLKVTGMFNFMDRYRPAHESSIDWNVTSEATRILNHERSYTANGILNYVLNQNTFVDLKAGYIHNKLPIILDEEANFNPQYYDESTGHIWGSGRLNETSLKKRFQANACITHFQDNFLGADHELKAGAEYEYNYGEWTAWKENNLLIHYNNGNPYFFGLAESPETGSTVGKGKISFSIASRIEGGLKPKNEIRRFGFFLQDSATFAERVTLNFGIRFDRSTSYQLAHLKAESGNPVSQNIGEELIKPIADVNPYGENIVTEWKDLMTWNALSPRIGLIFDISGNGKSIFKASFSRYSEYMKMQYLAALNPFNINRSHSFIWYDENMDNIVDDTDDTYALFPEDYRLYIEEYYKKRIDPETKSPYTHEFLIGLQHEFFNDFSVGINCIYKETKNVFENVLYNPDLDMNWYTTALDTEQWWIPFNTIIPGIDDYPETDTTVYFLSKDAPPLFERYQNVPELKRKYQAIEFVFKKRMSNNWQLNGSVVLSKSTGNIGLGYGSTSGSTPAANSPNYFVNNPEDSRLDFDQPLVIKMMGTYRFPFGFFLSFYYTHMSGAPWARSISVLPPSSWTEKENAYSSYMNVILESPGTRRDKAIDNLDIRIEKEFQLTRSGRVIASIDITNALGNKYRTIFQNDGGYWFPADENSVEGTRILSPNYKRITSLFGARVLKFSLNFSF